MSIAAMMEAQGSNFKANCIRGKETAAGAFPSVFRPTSQTSYEDE
jgi:hypothetical protein